MLAAPNRIGVAPEVTRRILDGRMRIAPDGTTRVSDRYIMIGRGSAARPDPVQAAWLYAQMVRWGQAPLSVEFLDTAKAVFRPDLYDKALEPEPANPAGEPADGIGAFAGPAFDANDIVSHLAAWSIRR
jgi:NitT/TauT family transport system ATP-binding protein